MNANFKQAAARVRIAIVYPGSMSEGVASLAIHGLGRLINKLPGVSAEHFFWSNQANQQPSSLESKAKLSDFDLLAFSVSFEEQFVLIPHILSQAGIDPLWKNRHAANPIVLVGGVAARLNPRPILPFIDLLVVGDAEDTLPAILERLDQTRGQDREKVYQQLAELAGVGVRLGDDQQIEVCWAQNPKPVAQLGRRPESHFKDMYLLETGRGCPAGCRFCAVSYSRRPPLFFSVEQIVEAAQEGLELGLKIGLVGASLARHPQLLDIIDQLSSAGADFSPASLDARIIASPMGIDLVDFLAKSKQKTVTIAPESGSQRLRKLVNKPLDPAELECAVSRLGGAGIVHLKLYLMYGLPTEEQADLEETVELVSQVHHWFLGAQKSRGKAGRLVVSINPFVPKPHTPFGLEPMNSLAVLKKKKRYLDKNLKKIPNVDVSGFSPRLAMLQCLIDRGDESLSKVLLKSAGTWPPSTKLLHELLPNWKNLVSETWSPERLPPWRISNVKVDPGLLDRENDWGHQQIVTQACDPDKCGSCGSCSGLT
jgi:radical SAM superfamily enzyme YgiQ (UPF0313 family)